ncbi:MAG: TIGR01777 family oxidoreductase [Methanosarcina sp.]
MTGVPQKSSVLITGGSGLIGKYLTSFLLAEGYSVSHLSRGSDQFGRVRVHRWDPAKKILDPVVLSSVDYIIHLAGANLGDGRWTANRKSEIISSRVDSARLLYDTVIQNDIKIKGFISASGISCYGTRTTDHIFTEEDPVADDFLGMVCRKWEEAADLFALDGIRTVKIRTAVVLERNDSALTKMMMPARFGFLAVTGSGRQYMPWIHIKDICGIYLKALEDESMKGAYNAVSPQHVTHKEFIQTLGAVTGKAVAPVHVPAITLKAAMGEMAGLVLEGSRVSPEKIINAGYEFKFSNLHDALVDVFK